MKYKYRKTITRHRKKARAHAKKSVVMRPNYQTTTFITIVGLANVSNAGAAGDLSLSIAINYPGYFRNNGTTWGLMTVPAVYARMIAAYREYHSCKLTTAFIPAVVNDVPLLAAVPDPYSVYMYKDYNNANDTATQALAGGRIPKPISAAVRAVTYSAYPSKVFRHTWAGTSFGAIDPGTVMAAQAQGQLNPGSEHYAESIKVIFPNTASNVYLGQLVCRWRVGYRGIIS